MSDKVNDKRKLKKPGKNKKVKNSQLNKEWEYPDVPYMLYRLTPKSEKEFSVMGNEVLKWSECDDALKLTDYATLKRMPYDTFIRYTKRSKYLGECWEIARERVTSRRELGALKNKYNSSVVMGTMGMYDKEYKEFLKWKSDLRKDEKAAGETKIVVLEKYPNSDVVPEKKLEHRDEDKA